MFTPLLEYSLVIGSCYDLADRHIQELHTVEAPHLPKQIARHAEPTTKLKKIVTKDKPCTPSTSDKTCDSADQCYPRRATSTGLSAVRRYHNSMSPLRSGLSMTPAVMKNRAHLPMTTKGKEQSTAHRIPIDYTAFYSFETAYRGAPSFAVPWYLHVSFWYLIPFQSSRHTNQLHLTLSTTLGTLIIEGLAQWMANAWNVKGTRQPPYRTTCKLVMNEE